jgi:hypothetical protein
MQKRSSLKGLIFPSEEAYEEVRVRNAGRIIVSEKLSAEYYKKNPSPRTSLAVKEAKKTRKIIRQNSIQWYIGKLAAGEMYISKAGLSEVATFTKDSFSLSPPLRQKVNSEDLAAGNRHHR